MSIQRPQSPAEFDEAIANSAVLSDALEIFEAALAAGIEVEDLLALQAERIVF